MKVQKSKSIRIQITLFISICIAFMSGFAFVLGQEYSWIMGVYFLVGTGVLIAAAWIVCFILIKLEKQYFIITSDSIILYQNKEVLCKIQKVNMVEIKYIRFVWALLMQMGSGYLNITCPIETLADKKYATLILPDGTAIVEISMTLKQARMVSKVLGKNLKIK